MRLKHVFIRELNKWSIIPAGSVSSSGFKVDVDDNDVLGLGHEFRNVYARNTKDGTSSFNKERISHRFNVAREFGRQFLKLALDLPFAL